MRRLHTLAVAALLVAIGATASAAQAKPDRLSGTRVRVTAPNFLDHRITGTVTSFTADGLVVREEVTGTEYDLPLHSIARLDPFKGGSPRSTAWYRGRVGAFLGGGLGAIAGALIGKASPYPFGQTIALSAAVGLVGGGSVGAMAGALYPAERWGWAMSPWGYDRSLRPTN
jgi:hypothetical protein